MATIQFNCGTFKRLPSPSNCKYFKAKTYLMVISMKDLPKEFEERTGISIRKPELSSPIAKKIRESLVNEPDLFVFKNRGLFLFAEKIYFDNRKEKVKIEMTNSEKHGLFDGGHTFAVLKSYLEGLNIFSPEHLNASIRIEVTVGIEKKNDVVKIVDARSTSTQLIQENFEELYQVFEDIKTILQDQPYADKIAYKEYEINEQGKEKEVYIEDILSYLICFDSEVFNADSPPITFLDDRESLFAYYLENYERLKKYFLLLPEILSLRDKIYEVLPIFYHQGRKKFEEIRSISKAAGEEIELPFIQSHSDYLIPTAYVYPILFGLRNLVEIKDGQANRKINPEELLLSAGESLPMRMANRANQYKAPNEYINSDLVWQSFDDYRNLAIVYANEGNKGI